MSRDQFLKYRVRCRDNLEVWRDDDPLEYFKTLEEATQWARRAARAGRFKHLVIQDMGGGYGQWVVLDEVFAPKPKKSN